MLGVASVLLKPSSLMVLCSAKWQIFLTAEVFILWTVPFYAEELVPQPHVFILDGMDGANMDGICCKRDIDTSPGEDLMIACRLWVEITVRKPLKLWPVEAVRSALTCNMKQGNTLIHLIIHFQYKFRCNLGSQSIHSIFELALSIRYFIIDIGVVEAFSREGTFSGSW